MKVIWTRAAFRDRLKIWEHIAEDNPSAAAQLDEAFSRAGNRLVQHPGWVSLEKFPELAKFYPMNIFVSSTRYWVQKFGFWPWFTQYDNGRR